MSSEMSSEGSDIELQSALPKTSNKKMPPSPSEGMLNTKTEKKLTTKIMINQALTDLKSRKGVSLYAIKKYIQEKYNVDTEKLNYHIKKYIKSAVEEGKIVQTKGIGASGSFKLVPVKEKKPKPKKLPKEKKEKKEKPKNPEKKKKTKEISMDDAEKPIKKKTVKSKENKEKSKKTAKPMKKMEKEKEQKIVKGKKNGDEKEKKVRIAKGMKTPSKKKSMMRRKSIGSIIKPPKMKPSKSAKA